MPAVLSGLAWFSTERSSDRLKWELHLNRFLCYFSRLLFIGHHKQPRRLPTTSHRPLVVVHYSLTACHKPPHRPSSPLYSDSAINEHSMLSLSVIGSQCESQSVNRSDRKKPIPRWHFHWSYDSNLKYTVVCPNFTILISDRLKVRFNEATFVSLPLRLYTCFDGTAELRWFQRTSNLAEIQR